MQLRERRHASAGSAASRVYAVATVIVLLSLLATVWLIGRLYGHQEWGTGASLKVLGHYAVISNVHAPALLRAGSRTGDDLVLAGDDVLSQAALFMPDGKGIRISATPAFGLVGVPSAQTQGAELEPTGEFTLRRGNRRATIQLSEAVRLRVKWDDEERLWSIPLVSGETSQGVDLRALVCPDLRIAISESASAPNCASDSVIGSQGPRHKDLAGKSIGWTDSDDPSHVLAVIRSGTETIRAAGWPSATVAIPGMDAALVWRALRRPRADWLRLLQFPDERYIAPVVVSTTPSAEPLLVDVAAGNSTANLPLVADGGRIVIGGVAFVVKTMSFQDSTIVAWYRARERGWEAFFSSALATPSALTVGYIPYRPIATPDCQATTLPRVWMPDEDAAAPTAGAVGRPTGAAVGYEVHTFPRPRWTSSAQSDGFTACVDADQVRVAGRRGPNPSNQIAFDATALSGAEHLQPGGTSAQRTFGPGDVFYFGGQVFEVVPASPPAFSSLKSLPVICIGITALPLLVFLWRDRRTRPLTHLNDADWQPKFLGVLTSTAPILGLLAIVVTMVSGAWYQLRLATDGELVGHTMFYSTFLTSSVLALVAATLMTVLMSRRRLRDGLRWTTAAVILGTSALFWGGWVADLAAGAEAGHLASVLKPPTPWDAGRWLLLGILPMCVISVVALGARIVNRFGWRRPSLGAWIADRFGWRWPCFVGAWISARISAVPKWPAKQIATIENQLRERRRPGGTATVPTRESRQAHFVWYAWSCWPARLIWYTFAVFGFAFLLLLTPAAELLPPALAVLTAWHLGVLAPMQVDWVIGMNRNRDAWPAIAAFTGLVVSAALLYFSPDLLRNGWLAWSARFGLLAALLALLMPTRIRQGFRLLRGEPLTVSAQAPERPWRVSMLLRSTIPYLVSLGLVTLILQQAFGQGDLGFALVWAVVISLICATSLTVLLLMSDSAERHVVRQAVLGAVVVVSLPIVGIGTLGAFFQGTEWATDRTITRFELVESPFYSDESDWLARVRWLAAGAAPQWIPNLNSDIALPGVRHVNSAANIGWWLGVFAIGALLSVGAIEAFRQSVVAVNEDEKKPGIAGQRHALLYGIAAAWFGLFVLVAAHLIPARFDALPLTGVPAPWLSHANITHVAFTCLVMYALNGAAALARSES